MEATTLRTRRLVLQPLGTSDIEAATLYADRMVMRHLDGGVRGQVATVHSLEANERCWRSEGWGLWALRHADTGSFLGECGLCRNLELRGGTVEFCCTLSRRGWGQGYSTEAGNAVISDSWSRYAGNQIHALTSPANSHGSSLLNRLGFSRLDDQVIGGSPMHVWIIQRHS